MVAATLRCCLRVPGLSALSVLSGYRPLDAAIVGLVADRELALIEETLAQGWPACGGEQPSPASAWRRRGFTDDDVQRYLEAGVHSADAAAELRAAGVDRRHLTREIADGLTVGLAYSDRELTLEEVLHG